MTLGVSSGQSLKTHNLNDQLTKNKVNYLANILKFELTEIK